MFEVQFWGELTALHQAVNKRVGMELTRGNMVIHVLVQLLAFYVNQSWNPATGPRLKLTVSETRSWSFKHQYQASDLD